METTWYLDEDGYKVEIGTVVGYAENFADADNEDKYYVIRKMPNSGDTIEMSECTLNPDFSVASRSDEVITVKPFMIGAI